MATWVMPAAASQSASRSSSWVVVPKVAISLWGWPSGSGTIRQATTVFLCTSRPAQRGYSTFIGSSLGGGARRPAKENLLRVLPRLGSDKGWYLGAPGANG